MNKKIYYNDKFIEFSESKTQTTLNQTIKIFTFENDEKLKIIFDHFLNQNNSASFLILNCSFNYGFNFLKQIFSYIEAAGGFIENDKKYLFIHRLGKWDLPKGKLDSGESIQKAALRECEEECGVKDMVISKQLNSTFHIYPYKNNFALKQTFWFYMKTDYSRNLVPQLEENIDEVRWFSYKEAQKIVYNDTYLTIKDVMNEALSLAITGK